MPIKQVENNSRDTEYYLGIPIKRFLIYTIISIPGAIILNELIEKKHTIAFWTFMFSMGLCAIIAWSSYIYSGEFFGIKKNKILRYNENILWILTLTFFMWGFIFLIVLPKI